MRSPPPLARVSCLLLLAVGACTLPEADARDDRAAIACVERRAPAAIKRRDLTADGLAEAVIDTRALPEPCPALLDARGLSNGDRYLLLHPRADGAFMVVPTFGAPEYRIITPRGGAGTPFLRLDWPEDDDNGPRTLVLRWLDGVWRVFGLRAREEILDIGHALEGAS